MAVKIERRSWKIRITAFLLAVVAITGCTSLDEGATLGDTGPSEEQETILTVKYLGGREAPECSDNAYLEEASDYIIDGTVISFESRMVGEDIFTYTDIAILAWGKGNPFPVDGIQVVTPGGTAEGITQIAEDQPAFHQGGTVRLYIQKSGWDFMILCGQMGVWEL